MVDFKGAVNEKMFERELTDLINKHSLENTSNTADFILAKHLVQCLKAFNSSTNQRIHWYGNPNKKESETK